MRSPSSRADIAYKALRQAIIEQALLPGTKLPEDEIGATFAMSRTLVRATLSRLHAEGLVEMGGKRTATIAMPSLAEAREVFNVRRALEREVVRLVIARWKPEFGARLEGHVREEDRAKARSDTRVAIRLAGEFHILLAGLTGNGLLLRYISEVVSRCSLILALYGRPHSSDCAVNEHHEIIAALRGGDAALACHLMDHHLALVEERALIGERNDVPDLTRVLSTYADQLRPSEGVTPLALKAPGKGVRAGKARS